MKGTVIPVVNRALDTVTKRLIMGLEDLETRGRVKKSPGDLRRFAVTQTPIENHQLMLM